MNLRRFFLAGVVLILAPAGLISVYGAMHRTPTVGCGASSMDSQAAAAAFPVPIAARIAAYPEAGVINHLGTLIGPKPTAASLGPVEPPRIQGVERVEREFPPCGRIALWRVSLTNDDKYYFAREPVGIHVDASGVTVFFEQGVDVSVFDQAKLPVEAASNR